MKNWKNYKLNEAVEKLIDYRGKTPTKSNSGIPLITAKVIKDGRINTPEEFIEESLYDEWMTRGIPEYGDVVLTTEAPLGEVAQIKTHEKIALAQRVITLRGKKGVIDSTYLKYFLQSPVGQGNLKAKETGSTVTGIKQSELREIIISAPDFETQKEIASILSSLDEKIELNQQMNETLEAIGQGIFKEWFVNFNFPGFDGELVDGLPKGWEFIEIGELIERGILDKNQDGNHGEIHPKSKDYVSKGIPFIMAKDIINDYIDFNNCCYISKEHSKTLRTGFAKAEDVLLTHKATMGRVAIVPDTIEDYIVLTPQVTYYRILDKSKINKEFLFFMFKSDYFQKVLESQSEQSTRKFISITNQRKLKFVFPNSEILTKFGIVSKDLLEKINFNNSQIQVLTDILNNLLPRLMNGKLSLPLINLME